MKQLHIVGALFCALIMSGCEWHSKEALNPDRYDDCLSEQAKYSTHIKPILVNSCYSCHSTVNAPLVSGIDLEQKEILRTYALSGQLMGVLEHQDGFVPMPAEAPKLDSCSIEMFKKWINEGVIFD